MASKALVRLLDPFLSFWAVRYQASVASELRKYGLRYEDLYDPLLNQVGPPAGGRLSVECSCSGVVITAAGSGAL